MRACSLACTQLRFSIHMQFRTPFLGNGAARSGLALPTPVNLIETSPTGQPSAEGPSFRLSSQMTFGCVKSTIKPSPVSSWWKEMRFREKGGKGREEGLPGFQVQA